MFDDKRIAELRALRDEGLVSAVGEYAPEEFWEALDELERLTGIVVASRSSVKFDLLRYEKMARTYGNLGEEGEQIRAVAEAEAQRLHELLEKIDALELTTSNVRPRAEVLE